MNILVIESRREQADRLRGMLDRGLDGEVETLTVQSGADAKPMMSISELDCVVVGLNGKHQLEVLRSLYDGDGGARTLPLVVVGEEPAAVVGAEALRFGADEYLTRAEVDEERLTSAVFLAIERRRLRSAEPPIRDPLTALPNRLLFRDRVRAGLARRKRGGGELAVIFIDLDGFKEVNDGGGHAVGDAVLIEIGNRLAGRFRSSDTVARYGGDEFAVLCEGPSVAEHMMPLADKARDAFAEEVIVDGRAYEVGASVGVSLAADASEEPASVIARADAAMYQAKRFGRAPADKAAAR